MAWKDESTRSYSSPNRANTRFACSSMALMERSSGVLLSRASPVHDTNTVGMHSVLPLVVSRRNAGEVGSHAV